MISIIIPTYQHATTIVDCLNSIFSQTMPVDEIIVVNDGSTDNTLEKLNPFLSRIHLINQKNQGRGVARNRGFDASHGDFVLFCDADVIMNPEMISKMHEALIKNPACSYAYCSFRLGWKKFSSYPFSADRLRKVNYIHTMALIRRKDFTRFDENLKKFQDWDLWLTMLEKGKKGIFVPLELFQIKNAPGRKSKIASFAHPPSQWFPSFFYKIPWHWIGWKPKGIIKYEEARKILAQKHQLL